MVLTAENPIADIIAARLFVRAGSLWEPPAQAGLTHLLAAVLTKGTQQKTAREIAEQVESVGANLGADPAPDYFLLSLKTVSEDFSKILQLAAELLRSPSFPEIEIELERRLALQAIRSQQEQPFTLALAQLRQSMYGNHPYFQTGPGTEATVAPLQQADLRQFHQTHFRPDNLVITIVGRITHAAAIALVETYFGDWQAPPTPLPALALPQVLPQPQQQAIAQPTQQAIVMVGYLAPSIYSPDYPALKLLSTYLGNGLSSRLFVELREKRGLAYEVSAFYPTRRDTSHFVVYMGTAPENAAIALESLQAECDRLYQAPLPKAELQAAQNKILGQYALGKQTNSQIAQTLGWYETLELGAEYDLQFQHNIAQVTPTLAHQVAQKYLSPAYISLVGPAGIVK